MDLRLCEADKLRVILRKSVLDRYHILLTSRSVTVWHGDRVDLANGKEKGKLALKGKDWHHFKIQSKGPNLRVEIDGKLLMDERQANLESYGFYFQGEGGKVAIKNVKVKALR